MDLKINSWPKRGSWDSGQLSTPPPPALPSRRRGGVKFADVGTKVIPSMLTVAQGVVKVKRLLEVSGHQRVMHGSRPRDGTSPVVKVRARCPGLSTATDM